MLDFTEHYSHRKGEKGFRLLLRTISKTLTGTMSFHFAMMTRALTVATQQIRTSYLRPSSSPSSKRHVSLPRGSVGVGKDAGTFLRRLSWDSGAEIEIF